MGHIGNALQITVYSEMLADYKSNAVGEKAVYVHTYGYEKSDAQSR